MNPNKRGNPPFEPTSYAAGMERRIKRQEAWIESAMEAARLMVHGSDSEQQMGIEWWKMQFEREVIVLS